jgi:hypothetical protein
MSRTSKQGSAVSRNQSLIKKNVAPQDLRPSDILIERFVAWKAIVKQLIAYFEVSSVRLEALSNALAADDTLTHVLCVMLSGRVSQISRTTPPRS